MILKKDSRPVFQQVLSGLMISAAMIAIVAGLAACLSFAPGSRITAFFWHLRYGTTVDVGVYRFPAPKQWYVQKFSSRDVLLFNLENGDTIQLMDTRGPNRLTLPKWSEVTSKPSVDTKVTGQRALRIENENVLCVEKDVDMKNSHMFAVSCRSEGALEILFTSFRKSRESGNEAFYSMLQQTKIVR